MGAPRRLLIVGNGMASVRLLEELHARCPDRYRTTVVGAERRPGYNRVLLSSLLAGDIGEADIALRPHDWYAEAGATLLAGETVASVDLATRTARVGDRAIPFDHIVFATGSNPIRLPKPGMDLPGVMAFRDTADVDAMRAAMGPERRAIVIGGGLLGIEAAYGLAKLGAHVTLVHLMDQLMERQLDRRAGEVLARALERRGVSLMLGADTAHVTGTTRAEGVAFTDGREVPAHLVVVAVGVRPSSELAKAAGVPVARGILVDDALASAAPGVFALGECAEHRGQVYGLVEPAYDQARVLAARLAGDLDATYRGTVLATNLKVSGVPVFSAGDFSGEGAQTLTLEDRARGHYRKLCEKDGRLVGCVMVGETGDGLWYRDLIRAGTDIASIRATLLYGAEFCQDIHQEAA